MSIEELIETARSARELAYAPYSRFKVGAALESRDGRVFTGCNVENSSYGLTICAERTAIAKAISEGVHQFSSLVIVADTQTPIPPCGACRQVILEICGADIQVIMTNLRGDTHTLTAGQLLPAPFDNSFL